MKKRFLGTVLAAALVVSSAISVFALGSKTAAPTVVGESEGKYEITSTTAEKDEKEVFAEMLEGKAGNLDAETAAKVVDQMTDLNKGEDLSETIFENIAVVAPGMSEEEVEKLKEELKDKEQITKTFNLVPIDGGVKNEDGKYVVTLSVPEITKDMTGIKLLRYNTETLKYECIEPEEIDFESKEITFAIDDLDLVASPAVIIADKVEEK